MSLTLLKKSYEIVDNSTNKEGKINDERPTRKTFKPYYKGSKKTLHESASKGAQQRAPNQTVKHTTNQCSVTNKQMENAHKLLYLSKSVIKPDVAEKIVKLTQKDHKVKSKKIGPKNQKSIFTEEDFLNFEREYFNS